MGCAVSREACSLYWMESLSVISQQCRCLIRLVHLYTIHPFILTSKDCVPLSAMQCQPYSSKCDPFRCALLLIWREWKWNHDLYPVAIQYPSEIITKRAFVICSVLIWWHVLRGWIPLGPGTQFSSGSYRSSVSSILSENRRLIICTFVRLRAVI